MFPDILTPVELGYEGKITVAIHCGDQRRECTVNVDYLNERQTNLQVYVSQTSQKPGLNNCEFFYNSPRSFKVFPDKNSIKFKNGFIYLTFCSDTLSRLTLKATFPASTNICIKKEK